MAYATSTYTAIAAVVAAAAGGYSAYSSYEQGKQAQSVSNWNRAVQAREAEKKRLVAERNIEQQKRQDAVQLQRQRLAFGLSGVDPASGSLLESQLQTKEEMAYTEAFMEWQKRAGIDTAVTDIETTRLYGQQSRRAANTQGVGNLLSGVSHAASIYA